MFSYFIRTTLYNYFRSVYNFLYYIPVIKNTVKADEKKKLNKENEQQQQKQINIKLKFFNPQFYFFDLFNFIKRKFFEFFE